MRLREQNKGDLALAAITLTVIALTAGYEAGRWVIDRLGRRRQPRPPMP